jgi:hypothetical protein
VNGGRFFEEDQGIRKTKDWRRNVRHQLRYCGIDLSRLPDIVLVAKQIDVCFDTFHQLEIRARISLMLRLVPFTKIDIGALRGCADSLTSVVARMIV